MGAVALVVDDNPLNTKLFQALLASRGIAVLSAASGCAALQTLGEHQVDLVVLDVMLPDMSGLDLLPLIRSAAAPNRPRILLVTAFPAQLVARSPMGIDGFMGKPIAAGRFLAEVDRLLERPVPPLPVPRPSPQRTATAALAR